MQRVVGGLAFLGRHGPWVFVVGIVISVLLPGLAAPLRAYLTPIVIMLLTGSLLLVDPAVVVGQLRRPTLLIVVIILYLGLSPFLVWGLVTGLGLPPEMTMGVILLACAPPLTATVTFAALIGLDTALALNSMVIAHLLVPFIGPFTVAATLDLPVDISVAGMFLHLLIIVASAVALGSVARKIIGARWINDNRHAVNGINTLFLLVFLLASVGTAVEWMAIDPGLVAMIAASAFAANWGLQILYTALGETLFPKIDPHILYAITLGGGSRSMVLFIPALPDQVMTIALIFLGTLQLPIYLTPLVMGKFYQWRLRARGRA